MPLHGFEVYPRGFPATIPQRGFMGARTEASRAHRSGWWSPAIPLGWWTLSVHNPMKNRFRLIPLLALWLPLPPASASDAIRPYLDQSGESDQLRYAVYNNRWLSHSLKPGDDKNATRLAITGVLPGVKGKVVIPSSIDGHEVYGMDERALESGQAVTAITLPKSLRFLKPGTLSRGRALEAIHVADGHPDFATVDGVVFDPTKTRLLAFPCGRSGDYAVPDGTTSIGPAAFSGCWLLKSVVIPGSVTDIGGHRGSVFEGCGNLEKVEIPDTVTNIGQKSFQDCDRLRQLAIPPKVTAIPFGLFWRCSRLEIVTLPDGITEIGNYAFADCPKLKLEKLPGQVTTIGAYAFKNCKELKTLEVREDGITLGRGAFQGTGIETPRED